MGRLLDALRAEIETRAAANPANPANLVPSPGNESPEIRRFAKFAAPHPSQAERLLAAIRGQGLPDSLLGLDHGDDAGLAVLTDAQLATYCAMLADAELRETGKVPADETARALCKRCGPVWVAPEIAEVAPVLDGWPRLLGCAFCHVSSRQTMARPQVTCGDCKHFKRDTINPTQGMGSCAAGCDPSRAWPQVKRTCAAFSLATPTHGANNDGQ